MSEPLTYKLVTPEMISDAQSLSNPVAPVMPNNRLPGEMNKFMIAGGVALIALVILMKR